MFDGNEPIYRQIADQIRDAIVAGDLLEEEQVMSTTQYATTFRINPATAAKAFTELIAEGVLYQRRGLGTFVAPGARGRLLAERRRHYFARVLRPALEEAERIGIPKADIAEYLAGTDHSAGAEASSPTGQATEREEA